MVRVERSSFCIFAYEENHPEEERGVSIEKTKYISKVGYYPMVHVVSLNEPNDFAWKNAVMELDLLLGEYRGYWKYHAPTINGLIKPKPLGRSTTIAPICCSILRRDINVVYRLCS